MITYDEVDLVDPEAWGRLVRCLRNYRPSPLVKERLSTMPKSIQLIDYADGTSETRVVEVPELPSTPEYRLARALYRTRVQRGFSLREVSSMLGVAPSQLSSIEHGGRLPTWAELEALLRTYGGLVWTS